MAKKAKASLIRPEDPRPETGPLYAINTTPARISFPQIRNNPGFILDPTPASRSVTQIMPELLDTPEFMRLWAPGKIAVSASPAAAQVYTDIIDAEQAEARERANAVTAEIITRDTSSDYDVEQHYDDGRNENTITISKAEAAQEAVEQTATRARSSKRKSKQAATRDGEAAENNEASE